MSDAINSPYYALLRAALEHSSETDEPAMSFHWRKREIHLDLNGESFEVDGDDFLAMAEQINPGWWQRYREPATKRITAGEDTTLPDVVAIEPQG